MSQELCPKCGCLIPITRGCRSNWHLNRVGKFQAAVDAKRAEEVAKRAEEVAAPLRALAIRITPLDADGAPQAVTEAASPEQTVVEGPISVSFGPEDEDFDRVSEGIVQMAYETTDIPLADRETWMRMLFGEWFWVNCWRAEKDAAARWENDGGAILE